MSSQYQKQLLKCYVSIKVFFERNIEAVLELFSRFLLYYIASDSYGKPSILGPLIKVSEHSLDCCTVCISKVHNHFSL
jgi:hypothetical protein